MSTDERFLLSRRALLGGIGVAGISAFMPRGLARAQETAPKRLMVVHVPEGMWNSAPRPTTDGNLGDILEALEPHRDYVTVLNNLTLESRDHGPGGDGHHRGVSHMLTGTEMADASNAGGPSVDQYIARAIGSATPFASLQLAVRIIYNDTNARFVWADARRAVPAEQDPWAAYDRVFGGVMPGMTTTPRVDLRRSALDHAVREIGSLRNRLPTVDRDRLDSYQTSLRDIERRLMTLPRPEAMCALPTLGGRTDPRAEDNYPAVGRLQMDVAVAAFRCDLTRVISLQWGNSNDQCSYPWLGVNNLGHDLAHNNGNCDPDGAKKLTVFRWYAEQFAYLLQQLRDVPEGEGNMLDNTLVLWASEFGDSNGHGGSRLMWVLMGNAGGYFRTGRVMDCGGRSTNDVLTSLCNGMGLDDATYGNPAYCDGPLSGLRA
jgi:hypothetical protein